ncbi:hypothetical protein V493_06877 [Pseudogymnoascus sp. VKM F-4281 (FW-2241)]|nr:hypothetical protein V493_06877 [Pseudogymnoascus sp. VKM F-4281 (FW-2241)]
MLEYNLPAMDMPSEFFQGSITEMQPSDFANTILPLYSQTPVTVYVGSSKYTISKSLLCLRSPYFTAMFKGDFMEGVDQTATLEPIDGVVSARAFEYLAQWLCIGRITFNEPTPEESISAAVEFSRFSDMCGITGNDNLVAKNIKDIILANLPSKGDIGRDFGRNTAHITSEHIFSASHLPRGHAVREILAISAAEEYIQGESHKFAEECHIVPGFSADLLAAVKKTLRTFSPRQRVLLTELIREEEDWLRRWVPAHDSDS